MMGGEERRTREKVLLRGKILDAVADLISRGGFETITMRKIAAEIEYSPTTIYRFFKNKKELLGAVTDRVYRDLAQWYRRWNIDDVTDEVERLKILIRAYIQFCLQNPRIYELYARLCRLEMNRGEMMEVIGGKRYRVFANWQDCLTRAAERGRLERLDPDHALIMTWYVTDGMISNRLRQPALPWRDDDSEIECLIRMVFDGILQKKGE